MWMLLLACVAPGEAPPGQRPQGPPAQDPRRLSALALPEATPFMAWSRVAPLTLVDGRGEAVLVLAEPGVALEVTTLLVDRALVSCQGCRAPLEAWVQREALFVGDTPGDGPHDALLAALGALPALDGLRRHGLAPEGGGFVSPPWADEGGYQGPVLVVTPEGQGFSTLTFEDPASWRATTTATEEG